MCYLFFKNNVINLKKYSISKIFTRFFTKMKEGTFLEKGPQEIEADKVT